jgi:p-aminobenzoyl-glutamate transporter AbgT
MNNSWKNWALIVLVGLNIVLIFLLVTHKPSHPPRLAQEMALNKKKAKALEALETPFLIERKNELNELRNLEHQFIQSAMKGDTLKINELFESITLKKNKDLMRMYRYFSELGVILNTQEQEEVLKLIGNFDRKPRP